MQRRLPGALILLHLLHASERTDGLQHGTSTVDIQQAMMQLQGTAQLLKRCSALSMNVQMVMAETGMLTVHIRCNELLNRIIFG